MSSKNTKVRRRLGKRYGKKCMMCGGKNHLTYHHIRPVREGGKTTEDNGAILCEDCHEYLNTLNDCQQNVINRKIVKAKLVADRKQADIVPILYIHWD